MKIVQAVKRINNEVLIEKEIWFLVFVFHN